MVVFCRYLRIMLLLINHLFSVFRRTVHDKMTGTDIRLSDEQVDLVRRLQQGKFGDVNFKEYEVPPNTNPYFLHSGLCGYSDFVF